MPMRSGEPTSTGAPVHAWIVAGDAHRIGDAVGLDAAHRHHHVRAEPSGGTACDRRVVHRHVASGEDVAHGDARLHQREFEREAASDQERHQIVVSRPHVGDVGQRVDQFAVLPYSVERDVGADVRTGGDGRRRRSRVEHVEDRARLGVALGEQEEIIGVFAWQGDHVRLRVSFRDTAGRPYDAAAEQVAGDGRRRGLPQFRLRFNSPIHAGFSRPLSHPCFLPRFVFRQLTQATLGTRH